MWAAWNGLLTEDSLLQQTVGYLHNISLPPTISYVIVENLNVAQNVAKEWIERYAVVTYDHGIAKPCLQIQTQEAPRFGNVFIMFGPFHITMCLFVNLVCFIDGSGGDSIMLNVELLASGSLKMDFCQKSTTTSVNVCIICLLQLSKYSISKVSLKGVGQCQKIYN